MDDRMGLADVLGQYCHIDGPHTADSVLDAGRSIAGLVRYLNHATQQPAAARTLGYANTIYGLLSNLTAAAYGMDQLLQQLMAGLERQATNPTLYDDRRDRPSGQTAHQAKVELVSAADAARDLANFLSSARDLASHLGNDER